MKSFSFLVLAFNHEKYIIEHLESIKFLVEMHAENIEVDLIINDDKSTDDTVFLINQWLLLNDILFRNVVKLFNNKNLGTCKSLVNMIKHVKTEGIKITAGDDVYSFENIFVYGDLARNGNMVSGFPLDLTNQIISEKKTDSMMIITSYYIYKNKKPIERFKWPSNNNAPNMFYDLELLKNNDVISYLNKFDVVEDLPLQIVMSNLFNSQFILLDKVFTYYRRTLGSTYIVAGSRFYKDQINIFNDLILNEDNNFSTILLKNRKFCFKLKNKYLRKILNLSIYRFFFLAFLKLFNIIGMRKKIDLKVELHRSHYHLIRIKANETLLKLKDLDA